MFWVLLGGFCPYGRENCAGGCSPLQPCCFREAGLAYADNDFPDADSSLIEVYVNSESDIDKLVTDGFDLAEYKRVEDDGKILVAIDADRGRDRRAEGAAASASARTIESPEHRAAVAAERDAQRETRRRWHARRTPTTACRRASPPCRRPGETVIQRANKFTNYAGTFLYVEAHNKATIRVTGQQHPVHRPDAGAVVRGRRRRLRRGRPSMPRFIDTDPTPDEYLYNRQLIRLTGAAGQHPGRRR